MNGGFYITVKNGLLDPKHIHAMGGDRNIGTVWLFLWLLDKMTIIDHEKGEGKILGGRPVRYDEIKKDLNISRATYARWIEMLREGGYISTLRTPYGLVITVYKAFKVFGRKTERYSDGETSDIASVRHHPPLGETSNKTEQLDNTVRQSTAQSAEYEKLVADIIFAFKEVNPSYKTLFNRPPQRKAVKRMLDEFGEEKLRKIIAFLPRSNGSKFAPTITTPVALENRMGDLMAFAQKERSANKSIVGIAI